MTGRCACWWSRSQKVRKWESENVRRGIVAAALLFSAAVTGAVRADLIPPECVVLYLDSSEASLRIAQHYIDARNIPPDHLVAIHLPVRNTISFEQYCKAIRQPVREFLASKNWGHTARCLVTSYDFPLRIADSTPDAAALSRASELEKRRTALIDQVNKALDRLDPQSRRPETTQPAEGGAEGDEIVEVATRYVTVRTRLFGPGGAFHDMQNPPVRASAAQFVRWGDGLLAVLPNEEVAKEELNAAAADRLEAVHEEVDGLLRQMAALRPLPLENVARDRLYDLTGELYGQISELRLVDEDLHGLRGQETSASLDNELSLLWCENYNRYRWVPNPAYVGEDTDPANAVVEPIAGRPAVMMVARLDGPSPEIVTRMIDTAIATEKKGLSGVFYIDARGIETNDMYAACDRNLVALADIVKQKTSMPVVLDQHNALFQPGQCPDAALYVGWHKPRHYTPAFDFVPGAVGVHLSSFAFQSIKGGGPAFWGPGLLKDGVAATFGPTDEPYLRSFPLPGQFFGLLLTGKYSIAECFYYTQPFLSWKMTLVGDPLYRPFAKYPQLELNDVLPQAVLPLKRIPSVEKNEHE